ncbi:hypothetical protein LCGC14_1161530 [marine sediment metagenome]|uniref:Type I restriction enzyme R protein N-terminal domain-containing protein n=1 Tax=marine sediment metagenome TaxID=412755 RepID=A0A0F9LXG5_9ZZZZ
MYNGTFTKAELENLINFCLQKLRRLDRYLLDEEVNERTITHKLAEYLQQQIPEFNVDCEYNRFKQRDIKDIVKRLELPKDNNNWDDTKLSPVIPDIIIHERGPHGKNILVIEVKKSSSSSSETLDRNKLIAFTTDPLNYELGLFLKIGLDNEDDIMDWYFHGARIN